ncbi:MAG TPA: dihydroneopterin aldolase [Candidatus Cybelea sp.]|nr:dihydroneopterin aldolase [Candidatus Cybelea sp.]
MGVIRLRGVRAYGRHGANPGERERRQLIEIDVIAELDLHAAQDSDDLSQTLDYDALHARIVRIVSVTSFALLERLGGEILDAIFNDDRVVRATVTLSKPQILAGATPSVTLAQTNPRRVPE